MTPEARHDQLFVQKVGEETIVYDWTCHQVHHLNKTAALVWRHCDGKTDATEIAALLQRDLGLPADEDVVCLAVDRLRKARLVIEDASSPDERVTRRHVIRKLGLVGALVLALPAVTSIMAPTPAMAQSAGGEECGPYASGVCTNPSPCPDPAAPICHPPIYAYQNQKTCYCVPR